MTVAIPSELRQLYRQGRLVPFVGAGVSMSVSWDGGKKRGPSWSELVGEAARQLGFDDIVPPGTERASLLRVRGTDLQILEYFKLRKESLAPLTNWLFAEMRAPDEALLASPMLMRLAELDLCELYYTTNYDDFLERALRLRGREPAVVATEAHMGRRQKSCEVVKFHGDLNHPERMVVTESDYERRLAFKSPMDLRLRSDLLGRAALFLGYSFRDPNVSYLFHTINEQLHELPASPTGRRAYIVTGDPSDFENRLFRARNMEVVAVRGDDLTQGAAAVLTALRE